jgi:FixJ family two-component response regulator
VQQQIGEKPRIYIVDDDSKFLTALRRFLTAEGFDVVAFESPAAFLAAHEPGRPGCLLLDLKMLEMSGLEVQSKLLADGEKRPVIFITGEADVRAGVTAMKRGARDYLLKPVAPDVLLSTVKEAVREDANIRSARMGQVELMARWNGLSLRERQVLGCVTRGRMNKQIAFELKLSEKTVKAHRARAMRKMKARTAADLVRMAAMIGARMSQ